MGVGGWWWWGDRSFKAALIPVLALFTSSWRTRKRAVKELQDDVWSRDQSRTCSAENLERARTDANNEVRIQKRERSGFAVDLYSFI